MLKRLLALAALCLGLAASLPAFAAPDPAVRMDVGVCDPNFPTNCIAPTASGQIPTSENPSTGTVTDKGGTVTTGGTAQTAIAANTARKGWCIQNDPAATETLFVRSGTTATTTSGVALSPGQQACNQPGVVDTALISVIAATTSHRWFGSEVQ